MALLRKLLAGGATAAAMQPEEAEAAGFSKLLRAFHGSHKDFDKFSSDYIGTGEGAQAFGHGLYSAQARDLGELYRKQAVQDRTDFFDPSLKDDYEIGQTAGQMGWNLYDKKSGYLDLDMPTFRTQKEAEEALESGKLTGQVGFSRIRNKLEKQLLDLGYSHYVAEEAADRVALAMLEDGDKFDRKHSLGFYKKNRDIVSDGAVLPDEVRRATIDALELSEPIRLESSKGRLYEIDIDASPDELLDWDKPVSAQSSKVQDAVEDILRGSVSDPDGVAVRGFDGETIDHSSNWSPQEWKFVEKNYRRLGNKISTNLDLAKEKIGDKGESYHQALSSRLGGQDKLAKALQERGVKGIQYKDAFSRTGEGGTSNYVVFDDKLISIAKKYGVTLPVAAAMLQQPEEAQAMFLPGWVTRAVPQRLFEEVGSKASAENLAKAEALLKQGRHPRTVWEETGFFPGADGMLRFEVPDDQARFKVDPDSEVGALPRPLEAVVDHPANEILREVLPDEITTQFVRREDIGGAYGQYNTLEDNVALAVARKEDPRAPGLYLPSRVDPKSVLLHELQHGVQEQSGMSSGTGAKVVRQQIEGNIWEAADDLYARKVQNRSYDALTDMGRSVSKIVNYLELAKYATDSNLTGKRRLLGGRSDWYLHGDDIRSELGPEPKRHRPKAEREEWLSAAWSSLSKRALAEISERDLNNAHKAITGARGKIVDDGVGTGVNLPSSVHPGELLNQYTLRDFKNAENRIYNQREKFYPGYQATQARKNLLDMMRNSDDFNLYQRTAGETEARNVQKRMGMTPEERAASYPPYTEDVAREDQIIIEDPLRKAQRGSADPRLLATVPAAGLLGQAAIEPTTSEKAQGVLDAILNMGQAAVAPISNAPHTLIQALTSDQPTADVRAAQQQRLGAMDYQPGELGQQYTDATARFLADQINQSNILNALRQSRILQTPFNAISQLPDRARLVGGSLLDALPL